MGCPGVPKEQFLEVGFTYVKTENNTLLAVPLVANVILRNHSKEGSGCTLRNSLTQQVKTDCLRRLEWSYHWRTSEWVRQTLVKNDTHVVDRALRQSHGGADLTRSLPVLLLRKEHYAISSQPTFIVQSFPVLPSSFPLSPATALKITFLLPLLLFYAYVENAFLNKTVLWMDKTDLIHGKGRDYFSSFVTMYCSYRKKILTAGLRPRHPEIF